MDQTTQVRLLFGADGGRGVLSPYSGHEEVPEDAGCGRVGGSALFRRFPAVCDVSTRPGEGYVSLAGKSSCTLQNRQYIEHFTASSLV